MLFSKILDEIKKCDTVLSGIDNHLINIGIAIGSFLIALSLLSFGKKLYTISKEIKNNNN
jgi:hypothetical protein